MSEKPSRISPRRISSLASASSIVSWRAACSGVSPACTPEATDPRRQRLQNCFPHYQRAFATLRPRELVSKRSTPSPSLALTDHTQSASLHSETGSWHPRLDPIGRTFLSKYALYDANRSALRS